ncbi:MAG: hypothetical protein ACRDU8_01215, partial [Egibacteraceae bacterium]
EVEADVTANSGTTPTATEGQTIVDGFEDGVLTLGYVVGGGVDNEWCITGAHTDLTGAGQDYEQGNGGLQDFEESYTATTCP